MNVINIGEQEPKKLPKHIERLFAAAEIPIRKSIPIYEVDRALDGLSIEERLRIKSELRQRGYIA